ncbi:MAG: MerR family transcriptional regulator [Candidatus Marinimicrobia bacterium]|nr:MerR family transcriptional regulator [Candidatus Neomarinimicrobiota bacterium]
MAKLYYSISEVADMLELKQYVLRYWETEFPNIKPDKNRAGNRVYKEKDIENFKLVQKLLHEKKFTIKGARQYLKDLKKSSTQQKPTKTTNNKSNLSDLNTLKKVKLGLTDLLTTIQKYK